MKKAKEAALEVLALLAPAAVAVSSEEATSASAIDTLPNTDAARAAADAYCQELLGSLADRQDVKKGLKGQVALVRELDSSWIGFAHRVSAQAPAVFGAPEFKKGFEIKARTVLPKEVASAVWVKLISAKERAAIAQAEEAARKAAAQARKARKAKERGKDRGRDGGKTADRNGRTDKKAGDRRGPSSGRGKPAVPPTVIVRQRPKAESAAAAAGKPVPASR